MMYNNIKLFLTIMLSIDVNSINFRSCSRMKTQPHLTLFLVENYNY